MTASMTTDVAPEKAWCKSSYSDSQGGSCVEIASLPQAIGIRDSKDKQGPALVVSKGSWSSFVSRVRAVDARRL